MSVAFIRFSGLQPLLDVLRNLELRNIPGRIITTTYMQGTEPKALRRLAEFPNIQTRVFIPNRRGFHTKGYLFHNAGHSDVLIGSANLTQPAMSTNVEWNMLKRAEPASPFLTEVRREFETQWHDPSSLDLSEELLAKYETEIMQLGRLGVPNEFLIQGHGFLSPNLMQAEAITNLQRLRKSDERRALAIAATGSGKTYMAVFDSKQFEAKRLLFIVHREDILRKAKQSFETVIDRKQISTGLFTGSTKEAEADYLFTTIQTLQRHYQTFAPDAFDYIVVDEAHHAPSPSYQQVLRWFQPKFMLGLTATPERSDAGDVYSIFDNNVAVEIRLRQALEWDLVAPFHYFGITDASIDYQNVDIDDLDAVAKLLMIGRRVDYVIEKMNFYGHHGHKRKALGFCASIEHAKYMAEEFNKRGIPSIALTGEDSPEIRLKAMNGLEDEVSDLQVIFTVDIFNEGIDIPTVNTVLMLRPTDSAIIFMQQLGRGLRKTREKEFVTVLDFIGNHRKSFLMAIALMGTRHFDKDDLKVAVKSDFADIPGCSYIQMDRIAKEQILAQLEQEKFLSMKYLRQEYHDFKHLMKQIPRLVDFLKVDGAVDPLKFSDYSGTWLQFLTNVEESPDIRALASDKPTLSVLKFFTELLPLRRIYEFVVAQMALKRGTITIDDAAHELGKHLKSPHIDTINYVFDFLSGRFFDNVEKEKFADIAFVRKNNEISASKFMAAFLSNPAKGPWLEDLFQYGILRYDLEFGGEDYGVPHLKLWEQYTMRSLAYLSNAQRVHSSFRGLGLITTEQHYFIFVDLNKDKNVKDSINYKDRFINPGQFQWETPNSTSPETAQGQRLLNHVREGITMHLFARKFREIEGHSQPFTYFGEVIYHHHDPKKSKPMRLFYKLRHEIPAKLYYEITEMDHTDANSIPSHPTS